MQQLFIGQGIAASIYNEPYSYAQQWNFDMQRELPGGMALSLAYAGSKGTHLPGPNQQHRSASAGVHGAWRPSCRNRCRIHSSER